MSKSRKNTLTQKLPRALDVTHQLKDLRNRLEEAENTLDAIRTGGVDALIVNSTSGTRVYTLQGADYGYQVMIENMEYGAVTVTERGEILYANRGFAEMLNMPLEKVVGTSLADFISPKDADILLSMLASAHITVVRGRLTLSPTAGGTIPVQVTINPLPNGSTPNLCVIVSDLRETLRQQEQLRHQEEELQQVRKMEAIGRLAGGVAHDFNNLIAGILGIGTELRTAMAENDPRRTDIDEIIRASERAFGVTKQLLAFGRRQVVQARVLNVDQVVQDLTRMLGRVVREDIQLKLVTGDAGHTHMDPTHLEQVVVNLVINARDAMPQGGELTIRTRRTDLQPGDAPDTLKRGSYAVLEVSDTGVGMSEETMSHIYEPFYTTKTKEQGTGLGLSTVYGIVKQNQGDILVDSVPGKGTQFCVYIPNAAPGEVAAAVSAPVPTVTGQGTILVVEDEDIVRYVVVRALRRVGYSVLEARDASEAIALSEQHNAQLDLIVTDVILVGMNGKEIAEAVRQRHPEARLLYMSGYPQDVISDKGILQDGVSFIDKTELQKNLIPTVREILSPSLKPTAAC